MINLVDRMTTMNTRSAIKVLEQENGISTLLTKVNNLVSSSLEVS